jgi:hypothetical protein
MTAGVSMRGAVLAASEKLVSVSSLVRRDSKESVGGDIKAWYVVRDNEGLLRS